MAAELQSIIQTEVSRIQKVEWLNAYVRARAKAFSTSNIYSAFSGTGINPFDATKVIHRVRSMEDIQSSSSESEHESESKEPLSLDPSLVPSSPIDISTYQIARTVLNEHMHQNPAFSTPVKTFIDRYTKSLDRIWTRNSITESKYNRLKEVLMDRKRHESGVRAVLKGHHIVTGDDVFERIVEAEAASRKKRQKKGHQSEETSSSQLNEEGIRPVDDLQPSGREIEDCIAVQF